MVMVTVPIRTRTELDAMPRTEYSKDEYNEIDANSDFDRYSTAKRKLADELKVNEYTKGTHAGRQAAEAQSIDYQVRKKLK